MNKQIEKTYNYLDAEIDIYEKELRKYWEAVEALNSARSKATEEVLFNQTLKNEQARSVYIFKKTAGFEEDVHQFEVNWRVSHEKIKSYQILLGVLSNVHNTNP